MEIYLDNRDITNFCGEVRLENSLDTLGDHFSFSIAYSDWNIVEISLGDLVRVLDDGVEEFRGVVTDKNWGGKTQQFDVYDFAFYLNKSKVIKQFNKVRADAAIRQLLDLQVPPIPIGEIAQMSSIIKGVYYDKEISDVIKDILDQVTKSTGLKFVMEMRKGKLFIVRDSIFKISPKVKLLSTMHPVDALRFLGNASVTLSIADMVNSVQVYKGDENAIKTVITIKNQGLIDKYGLLQTTEDIGDSNIAQAKNTAQNILTDKGRVLETASIDVLGSFEFRAGRTINLNEPSVNLIGDYKINSVSHIINGSGHKCSLDLGRG